MSAMMDVDFDLPSFGDSVANASFIQRLQRAWISERSAPDILPYEDLLLDAISKRLKEQVHRPTSALTTDRVDRGGITI